MHDLLFDLLAWFAELTLEALRLAPSAPAPADPAPLRRFAAPPKRDDPAAGDRRRRAELGRSFASLLMAVARADGRVASEERAAVVRVLQKQLELTLAERTAVVEVLEKLGDDGMSLAQAAARCREQLDVPDRILLLDALYAVANADGEVTREEQGSIREVATLLELDALAQKSALARNRGLAAVCYDVLGVRAGATDEEVRQAYLRRIAEADRPGGSVSIEARRSEIETAYQQIRELRGG